MSFNSKIYRVFIACPDDVKMDKQAVRDAIAKWNCINSEEKGIVLMPVSWDLCAPSEFSKAPQDYINEQLLDKSDILIALFWKTIGHPTKRSDSGSVEEFERHIAQKKLAMLFFCDKPIPPHECDPDAYKKVVEFKDKYRNTGMYHEYANKSDLMETISSNLSIHINSGKIRPRFDSDILAMIKDDKKLAEEIQQYFITVSFNLLQNIYEEERKNIVWDAIVEKLSQSPAELRDSLIFLARNGCFNHRVYQKGHEALANASQEYLGGFMRELYSINTVEFNRLVKKKLWHGSYKDFFMNAIKED